ncbi:CT20 family protein [Usnea florida]
MPPKKKNRQPSRAASTPADDAVEQGEEKTPSPTKADLGTESIKSDPWTDEQETSLFKSMIRWKPVGMHKHFRMISISENLRNHGYFSSQNAHTRIPGIWEKLGSLYNLETLDAREDSFGEPIQTDGDPAKQPFCPFSLPEYDYSDLMFAKRLASDGTSSPPLLAHQFSSGARAARRYSTVDDTDDPRSSPASISGQKPGRTTRTSKGARTSLLAEVSTVEEGQESKGSMNQGADEGQNDDEEDGVATEEDENDSKAAPTVKSTSKASKGAASKISGARRSGRKR